jgi:glycosyltransferase involved in cell wall biosynthesis
MLSQVSIVIPTFNEYLGLKENLRQLVEGALDAEVILVDDGSDDLTSDLASTVRGIKLIQHHRNMGQGSALCTGMMAASRPFVVWADADGQHTVADILNLARTLSEEGWDYCIGVRSSDSHVDKTRVLGKFILRKVVQVAAGRPIKDFNSGLRGFKTVVIRRYLHLLPKKFGASTTTSLIMHERNYRGSEVPIRVVKRVGKSSVRQFRDGMHTLTLIIRIFLIFKPLHFFGSAGLILILIGLSYGLIEAYATGGGFPVLSAIVFLSGLQTLFLGLVMDHISAMRRERFE